MKNIGCADLIIIILVICLIFFSTVDVDKNPDSRVLSHPSYRVYERDYVNMYCDGQTEYVLPDKTRIDCLTDEYAIEFDYAKKWAESIGQSLYYAKKTGKKPAVAIILRKESDKKYVNRIKEIDMGITVFEICSKEYDGEDKSACIKEHVPVDKSIDCISSKDNPMCFDRQPPYKDQYDQ